MTELPIKNIKKQDYRQVVKCAELNIIKTFSDFMGFNYQIISPTGVFIKTNRILKEKLPEGKKAGEIDSSAWLDCLRVMESGKSLMTEEEFDGVWYRSFKHPLTINHVCQGILVISIDITLIKEAEIELRKKNGQLKRKRLK